MIRSLVSPCGTRKLHITLDDGRGVETVLIPGRGRTTVCVSSQVGCARGCTFCVTALLGLVRSLGAEEITEQVRVALEEAEAHGLPPVRNVVFMGMGEPLDNLEEVRHAIALLVDPHAFALAPRHITLSTVGTSPRAIRAAADLPCRIAWSVHAVDDGLRQKLVPTSKHSMADLREAFLDALTRRHAPLFVEMTLIHDVNDGKTHAAALADFLSPFEEARVNVIPMNPGRTALSPSGVGAALSPCATGVGPRRMQETTPHAMNREDLRASSLDRVTRFQQVLRERGYFCAIRRARGVAEYAACGQLGIDGAGATS